MSHLWGNAVNVVEIGSSNCFMQSCWDTAVGGRSRVQTWFDLGTILIGLAILSVFVRLINCVIDLVGLDSCRRSSMKCTSRIGK